MSRDAPGPVRRWLQERARRHAGDRSGLTLAAGPIVRIASFDRQAAQSVARHVRPISDHADRDLARAYAALVEQAVAIDVDLGRSAARHVPEVIATVGTTTGHHYVEIITGALLVEPAAAGFIVAQGASLLADVPADLLRTFVAEGAALWSRDVAAGRGFLARESRAARAHLGAVRGLDLQRVQVRLTDYAHTFGVDLQVAPGEGTWPARMSAGSLELPSPLHVFGDPRDEQLTRVVVARACARLAAPIDLGGLCETQADLLDLFESRRVDATIRRRLPGLGVALDQIQAAPVARDQALARQPVPMQVRRLLAAWALRLPAPPAASAPARGVYEALVDELIVLDALGCTASTSARLAREFTEVLDPEGTVGPRVAQPGEVRDLDLRLPARAARSDDDAEPPPLPADGDEPAAGGEPGDPAGDEAGGAGGGEGAAPTDDPAPTDASPESAPSVGAAGQGGEASEAAPVGAYAPDEGEVDDAAPASDAETEVVASYPEWDPALSELRRDWAEVHEKPVQNTDPGFAERTLHDRAATIRSLRHLFLALRTQGHRPARRQVDGPDLDLDAAVAGSVDRRAGRLSDGRHYQRPHQRGRDVAVALLVDLSSSTREVLPDGMRIVDIEKEAVLCLGEALVAAGDRFAVLGFSGHGREDVQVSVAKDFSQPWDHRARAGVGGLRPLLENRDGAAIRHVTARLLAQDARTRLLVLLSDGRPLDCGDPVYHGEYARADTADALRSARASGVRPLCLTVAPEGTDALDRLYGRGAYVVVRDPARLAEQVGHHYAAWAHQ